jgi:antitoxin YefM
VEAPGTAPGSETLMSRGVYRHSRLPDTNHIGPMDTVSSGRSRQALDRLMDKVSDDRAPLIVKRPGKRPVVVMDLDEYRGMEETIHLMRSPANARRLLKSIHSLNSGKGVERALTDPKAKSRGSRRGRK